MNLLFHNIDLHDQDGHKLALALDLANRIIEHSNDSILISLAEPIDRPGPRVVYANETFSKQTGYNQEDIIGNNPRILHGPDTDLATLARIRKGLAAWQPIREEVLNYKKNGEAFWQDLNIFPLPNAAGEFTHWVSIQRDITERKLAEQQIYDLAFLDPLTGLPNRRLFYDRLRQTLLNNARSEQYGALLYIDLDHFKLVNDRKGHATGDLVLQSVAKQLSLCIRAGDTISRIGGDKYIILLDSLGKDSETASFITEAIAKRMLSSFSLAQEDIDHGWSGTFSIGISLFSGDQSRTLEDIVKEADLAMYQAKTMGRNRLQFFDDEMQRANLEKNSRIDILRQALEHNWFVLYFQPQVDQHGTIKGAEALIRLQHPTLGTLLPGTFIPLAESTNLIMQIGHWVITQACQQLALWATQAAFMNCRLSINVSIKQFQHVDFVTHLLGELNKTGANPKLLTLELTESLSLTESSHALEKMLVLKQHGIRFSLDDFGTGFSSLTYLKNLPFDELKIDHSFIVDLTTSPTSVSIVQATIDLGKSLGLTVITEGVETQEQLKLLIRAGCQFFQGYVFYQPLPLEAFEAQLREPTTVTKKAV
ncbi:MAG: EAL domain-containing protein [Burkholderiaceae bacterium]|nr:EAL domain-containing protein [Burkholderiaceae bacterium]